MLKVIYIEKNKEHLWEGPFKIGNFPLNLSPEEVSNLFKQSGDTVMLLVSQIQAEWSYQQLQNKFTIHMLNLMKSIHVQIVRETFGIFHLVGFWIFGTSLFKAAID